MYFYVIYEQNNVVFSYKFFIYVFKLVYLAILMN